MESYDDPAKLPDFRDIEKDTSVTFNGLMTDKSAQKKGIFTEGRPHGINIIFITQSYYEIPKRSIRDNTNFLILFRQNARSIESLHIDNVDSVEMDYKEIKNFVDDVWKVKHNFVAIEKTSEADKGKFRKNLDHFYIAKQYFSQ